LKEITQKDSFTIDVKLKDEAFRITSTTPMQIISAQKNPQIGWQAETLDKLYPSKTIIKKISNNEYSILKIAPKPQGISRYNDIANAISHPNSKKYQKADIIKLRPKAMRGTQYWRRIFFFIRFSIFWVVSFFVTAILSKIKKLRKYIYIIALLPNIAAISATLYLVLSHVN
jgi:hypothetical protein